VGLRDGSQASNPWLQELPDPVTKITWGNCAAIAPALARRHSIREGQLVRLRVGDRLIQAPAQVQPGQHLDTVSVAVGYGRVHAGAIGDRVGVNAFQLIPATEGHRRTSAVLDEMTPLSERVTLALTQVHSSMEGRPIVREATGAGGGRSELLPNGGAPRLEEEASAGKVSLWAAHKYPEYRWGLVIDLGKCTGCSACVTACDLENNVPAVGPEEVGRQREMHWLRIDRYYLGDSEAPRVVFQPMLCQHCANASCETVCPVLATVHDDQGLSVQVYNRCVGTRYCANNCPYKVRRFNFFDNISNDLTRNLALNPDVTVRSRGVMEKCSFCLQRIQQAKIRARARGRKVGDGEVQTACSQSCPAGAITFGNLADPSSRVSRLAASPLAYRVLEELNRQPAVYYLARVRNGDEGKVG